MDLQQYVKRLNVPSSPTQTRSVVPSMDPVTVPRSSIYDSRTLSPSTVAAMTPIKMGGSATGGIMNTITGLMPLAINVIVVVIVIKIVFWLIKR